jgi:integrase
MPRIVTMWKHPKSGILSFRATVPQDVRPLAGIDEYKRSLRTRDPAVARLRDGDQLVVYEAWLAFWRTGTVTLTGRQTEALVGLWYRSILERLSDDPGAEQSQTALLSLFLGEHTPLLIRRASRPWPHTVTTQAGALVQAQGLQLTEASLLALEGRMWARVEPLMNRVGARARGDYSADPVLPQFPEWVPPSSPAATKGLRGFAALYAHWLAGAECTQRSKDDYKGRVDTFKAFIGHDGPAAVKVADVVRWRDALLASGLKKKSINGKYLGAIGAVYAASLAHGVNGVTLNPVPAARFKKQKGQARFADSVEPLGFDDAQAVALLTAARSLTDVEQRWLPWLLAYTGLRLREAVQAVAGDVRERDGVIYFAVLTVAGRSVQRSIAVQKTKKDVSRREIPLHPHLVQEGFVQHARSLPADAFLFPSMRPTSVHTEPSGRAVGRYCKWVRTFAPDPAQDPNHAWRHRMKTLLDNTCPDADLREHLMGHVTRGVKYGAGHYLKLKAAAISGMPAQLS